MKILLINPRIGGVEDTRRISGGTSEPLGLAYLAAVLEDRKYLVEILDCNALNISDQEVVEYVFSKGFDVCGFTITTPTYNSAIKGIKGIKGIFNPVICVGGPHSTQMPVETLKDCPEIDIVVIGEGEATIVELMSAIEAGKDLSNIKGIAYREGESILITDKRPYIRDLDTIPFPARHLLPMELYRPRATACEKLPNYVIIGSRGCPFKCAFCAQPFGNRTRFHSPKRICDEMEYLINKYSAKGISFRDDSFTVNRKHAIEICNEMINRGINEKVEWSCLTRVNLVDYNLLKLMKTAGCRLIHYGIESGNQRLLDYISKGITLEEVKQAFGWTRDVGIVIGTDFILGLPTETRGETLKTIEFAKSSNPDWASFSIFVPYPGTKLYNQLLDDGKIKTFNWELYDTDAGYKKDKSLAYVPDGRTEQELKELQRKAHKTFYFRPKIIMRHLSYIRSYEGVKKHIKGFFALIR